MKQRRENKQQQQQRRVNLHIMRYIICVCHFSKQMQAAVREKEEDR